IPQGSTTEAIGQRTMEGRRSDGQKRVYGIPSPEAPVPRGKTQIYRHEPRFTDGRKPERRHHRMWHYGERPLPLHTPPLPPQTPHPGLHKLHLRRPPNHPTPSNPPAPSPRPPLLHAAEGASPLRGTLLLPFLQPQ